MKEIPATQYHLLIVDDVSKNIQVLGTVLHQQGYSISFATNGKQALEMILDGHYDLILLDIMMPDIKGYDVCKKIKSDDETKNTKIIVLSAYLDDEKFKKMQEYGADLCFSKPLPLPQLRLEVAQLLGLA